MNWRFEVIRIKHDHLHIEYSNIVLPIYEVYPFSQKKNETEEIKMTVLKQLR